MAASAADLPSLSASPLTCLSRRLLRGSGHLLLTRTRAPPHHLGWVSRRPIHPSDGQSPASLSPSSASSSLPLGSDATGAQPSSASSLPWPPLSFPTAETGQQPTRHLSRHPSSKPTRLGPPPSSSPPRAPLCPELLSTSLSFPFGHPNPNSNGSDPTRFGSGPEPTRRCPLSSPQPTPRPPRRHGSPLGHPFLSTGPTSHPTRLTRYVGSDPVDPIRLEAS